MATLVYRATTQLQGRGCLWSMHRSAGVPSSSTRLRGRDCLRNTHRSTRDLTQLQGRCCLWSTRRSAVFGASYNAPAPAPAPALLPLPLTGLPRTVGLPRTCYSFYAGFPRTTVRTASASASETSFLLYLETVLGLVV